ncbi:MAG TPA: glutaminyl-peptide cyclotransferase [Marinagarivorans sp.]
MAGDPTPWVSVKYTRILAVCTLALLIFTACADESPRASNTFGQPPAEADLKTFGKSQQGSAQPLEYRILATAPHIEDSFTQGWQLHNGLFYESSGRYRKSYLVRYTMDNTVQQRLSLPDDIFAEGLTLFNERLFLLTWRAGRAYEYDSATLTLVKTHAYDGEGWGLTTDGQALIMSNGSNRLHFRNPETFAATREITVHDNSPKIWNRLNELEYAKGLIWANVWQKPLILAIEPANGTVVGLLDLTELVDANTQHPTHETLNGIAYDHQRQAFWITGKLWASRYLIEISMPDSVKPE